MPTSSRRRTIAISIVAAVCSIGIAVALNITWVIRWREVGMVIVGLIFFAIIITGVVLNTIFVVREVRRNEQHDTFINAVTHELKTPIASIRLYLETLQARPMEEEQRKKFYSTMLQDTDRLLSTVEQVLRAGQVSHKSDTQSWMALDLGELAQECVSLARARHHLADEAIELRNHAVGVEETRVYGDPDGLRTAILNLLDNSVKYSTEKINIIVDVAAEGRNVLLRVRDEGVGIDPSEIKRIFRRFYRVPQRVKARVKGTGLGLFIVRSIAKQHGGDAVAYSAGVGRGTTVTLRLPRMQR